ncbi:uncharacterized protein LOC128395204 [Panonychus citri]|uniref:uncharacterized protein LOC128395204 n=1 Tax=Panonychus citri TaxID=50023 RepID=UPI0023071577|nr:uncharacterized protein LOC128395204 [Panonychus citri]
MSVNCHQIKSQINYHSREVMFFASLLIVSSLISGTIGKNSEPIIIILGPPGAGLPSSSSSGAGGPLGQIEATLSDRDSSGSSRSTFNLFRSTSSDKKDEKKGPHIIFIGGSASGPMNNGNNGPMMGSMQGPPSSPVNHGQGQNGMNIGGMNSFMTNSNVNGNGFGPGTGSSVGSPIGGLSTGPMRRGSSSPGVSVTSSSNNYLPYPMSSGSINSPSMVSNYPYIPYVMGGGGYSSPTNYPPTGYDYNDYVWNGWKR